MSSFRGPTHAGWHAHFGKGNKLSVMSRDTHVGDVSYSGGKHHAVGKGHKSEHSSRVEAVRALMDHHLGDTNPDKKAGLRFARTVVMAAHERSEVRECECGAPAVNEFACQRGHRLVEAWSPQARAAAALARKGRSPELESKLRKMRVGERHEPSPGVRITKDAAAVGDHTQQMSFRVEKAFPLVADHNDPDFQKSGLGVVARGLSMEKAMAKVTGPVTGSFKARPPMALRQRGQGAS